MTEHRVIEGIEVFSIKDFDTAKCYVAAMTANKGEGANKVEGKFYTTSRLIYLGRYVQFDEWGFIWADDKQDPDPPKYVFNKNGTEIKIELSKAQNIWFKEVDCEDDSDLLKGGKSRKSRKHRKKSRKHRKK